MVMPGRHRQLLAILALAALFPRQSRSFDREALFPTQETFHYAVEWRLIRAGRAKLTWRGEAGDAEGRRGELEIESTGLVSKLFKVEDRYMAAMDASLCATRTHMLAREGSRRRETNVVFDRERGKASYLEKDLNKDTIAHQTEIDVPACVHEVIGALYRLRALRMEPGQTAEVPMSDGKKSVRARVEAQEREEVRTPAGSYKAVRHEAFLFNNVLYRRPGRLFVWLTDDNRRLPVQIRVRLQFHIGTLTFQLEKEE